jgi:SAM-dependent methyltransferase
MATFDEWAEYYDLIEGDRSTMIAFYESLSEGAVSSVLDLGCGTGIILDALAKRIAKRSGRLAQGRITGLDGSSEMLKVARLRNPALEWVLGDMRGPRISGTYDLVISCFNTLQYCESDDDLLHVFESTRRLLAPGGTFAFDIYQPNIDYIAVPKRDRLFRRVVDAYGRELEVREDAYYDADTRGFTEVLRLGARDQPTPLAQLSMRFHQYFAADVEGLLGTAGFFIRERFGDLDRSRFDSGSKKQVVICGSA